MNRSNEPWSPSEEDFILWRISTNKTFESIAESTSRTPKDIEDRLRLIASDYVRDGKTFEEASQLTGIDAETIDTPSYSRNNLRDISTKYRAIRITQIVEEIGKSIIEQAKQGKTNYTPMVTDVPLSELREKLRTTFTDCDILCDDINGIRIDWS